MKDIIGNVIQVGDWIAYPGRSGSNLWMTVAVVVAVSESDELRVRPVYNSRGIFSQPKGNEVWHLTAGCSRCVVVQRPVIDYDVEAYKAISEHERYERDSMQYGGGDCGHEEN